MKQQPNIYGIVMAGGIGSRFWPLSRPDQPKQLLDIIGEGKTMIQETVSRINTIIPSEHIFVMTNKNLSEPIAQQLKSIPPQNILTEPERRNTAPCIAYAAYKLYQIDPEAIMLITPSDHYIGNSSAYKEVLSRAITYVKTHRVLLTIGIEPTEPATGYGYIELSEKSITEGEGPILRFTEKPNREEAEQMLQTGRYLWNSGMFVWRVTDIIKALEKHLPEVAHLFGTIQSYGTAQEEEEVRQAFLASPSISIDYGVMEKEDNVHVISGDFGWDDIGTWQALARLKGTEESSHYRRIDSPNSLIKSTNPHKKIFVEGLEDYLIIDTEDILMIVPKREESHLHQTIQYFTEEEKKIK